MDIANEDLYVPEQRVAGRIMGNITIQMVRKCYRFLYIITKLNETFEVHITGHVPYFRYKTTFLMNED